MKKIHLICNAHLDPVWLWEWEEGAAEAISTFRSAAELCENNKAFVFNHNEVILYEWVKEYEPKLFERIKKLVKVGRWHVMGGWYLQPDCNNVTFIQPGSHCIGLFGDVGSSGQIYNLGVEDVNIAGENYIGGLAGDNWASISNCYSTGNVNGSSGSS